MNHNRRDFLKTAAVSLAGTAALSAKEPPKLGLIFPVDRPVPPEGLIMYPTEVKFVVEHLDLESLTPEGYDKVVPAIKPKAEKLAQQGVNAIVLMGTSLTFYKGAAFNQQLTESIKSATGLPATTMSTAVIEGLKTVGAKRVVVATAYDDVVNGRLTAFLKENGFEVPRIKGLGIEDVVAVTRVTEPELLKFSVDVRKTAPDANAMLVSCGGLRTLEILAPLEKQTHVPAVSSTPHALWAGVRLLGLSGKVKGYGSLLEKG
jgi:arylmalonate decarboxylase